MTFQIYTPYICDISDIESVDQQTVITTAIDHAFVIGSLVAFSIPQEWGMNQLNGLKGYVITLTSDTITINIDSSQFDAFVTPSPPEFVVIDPAQVIPAGDANSGYSAPGAVQPQYQTIPGAYQGIIA